jgi:mannose/fructose/N-acetylgalactosamine-specific phosphotransferase system component IID
MFHKKWKYRLSPYIKRYYTKSVSLYKTTREHFAFYYLIFYFLFAFYAEICEMKRKR